MHIQSSEGGDIFILFSSQLLYSTYLLRSAKRTIGVDEGMSWEVHDRMIPAFEELFDEVEEHALNILLEPWTLLVNQDSESFQKVTPALLVHVQGEFLADTGQLLSLFPKLFVVDGAFMCVHVKVCVWEDVRSVNIQEYQELQTLYEDSQRQKKQVSPLLRVS